MSFSLAKFQSVASDYDAQWKTLDATLYDLCKENPGHQTKSGINAKLWIIGRAYATGIERMIPTRKTQGSSLEQLSAYLWHHRDAADAVLVILESLDEPLTLDKLNTILDAHGQLVGIVQRVVRKVQTPRSFVSKYLHFHNPAVPIYDSVAVKAACKLYRRERNSRVLSLPAGADKEYADFLMRFWRLYQEAQGAGAKVTVKLLDQYLLALAKEGAKK